MYRGSIYSLLLLMVNQIYFYSINIGLNIAISHIAFITSLLSRILGYPCLISMTSHTLEHIQGLLFQSL